jgi:hypothetical protein
VALELAALMAEGEPREETARRRGRRAGIAVFALVVTAFTAVCTAQILLQVWAPRVVPTTVGCEAGLRGLIMAVDRARREASEETGGERAAVARFRRALLPEWEQRPALSKECRSNKALARGLRQIDWLRYAEEHAVRYEAVDVAKLRRQVAALAARLGDPTR